MSLWRGRPPISVDGDYPSPIAPLGVCRVAVAVAVDVADLPIAVASPTAAVLRMPVGPSSSVASDGLQSAYGSHPLVGSTALGAAAGAHPGSSHLGLEQVGTLGSRRTVAGLSSETSFCGKPF